MGDHTRRSPALAFSDEIHDKTRDMNTRPLSLYESIKYSWEKQGGKKKAKKKKASLWPIFKNPISSCCFVDSACTDADRHEKESQILYTVLLLVSFMQPASSQLNNLNKRAWHEGGSILQLQLPISSFCGHVCHDCKQQHKSFALDWKRRLLVFPGRKLLQPERNRRIDRPQRTHISIDPRNIVELLQTRGHVRVIFSGLPCITECRLAHILT